MQGNLFDGFKKTRKKREVGLREALLLKSASAIAREVRKRTNSSDERIELATDFTIRIYKEGSEIQKELLQMVLTRLDK